MDGPKFGRRQADEPAPGAAVGAAPRRRAADGSEIAGGRVDAPSGWGEGSKASVFSRGKTTIAADASAESSAAAAQRIGDDAGDDAASAAARRTRGRGADAAEGDEVIAPDVDDIAGSLTAAPSNVAGRKVQTLSELARGDALDVSTTRVRCCRQWRVCGAVRSHTCPGADGVLWFRRDCLSCCSGRAST